MSTHRTGVGWDDEIDPSHGFIKRIRLRYIGTDTTTEPLVLVEETADYFAVRLELRGRVIDGARYKKEKWEKCPT